MNPESAGAVSRAVPLCSFDEDVLVEENHSGVLVVATRWGEFTIDDPEGVVCESLRRMLLGPISLDNVAPRGSGARANLDAKLEVLSGSVVRSLALGDGVGPVLSVLPGAEGTSFHPVVVRLDEPLRLSQCAAIRPFDGALLAESSLSGFRVLLHKPLAMRVVGALATGTSVAALGRDLGIAEGVVGDLIGYLVSSGIASTENEVAYGGYDDPTMRLWSHHELMFHTRSRDRRFDDRADLGDRPTQVSAPVTKAMRGTERFVLERPDLTTIRARDVTVTDLLEDDHACPVISDHAPTAGQLSELLFRSARVRGSGPAHLPFGLTHAASQRPYLSIACFYELELYLHIDRCVNLPRGIYHYDSAEHALVLINEGSAELAEILDAAKVAAGATRWPATVITVTARVERAAVLGGGAYATTLMHLGTLQQTLYLVAKAMGISAHAVPLQTGEPLDRELRLDWPAEVSIGQCVVDAGGSGRN